MVMDIKSNDTAKDFIKTYLSKDYVDPRTAYSYDQITSSKTAKKMLGQKTGDRELLDTAKATGSEKGVQTSNIFIDAFQNYIATLSGKSSADMLDILSSEENIAAFGQETVGGLYSLSGDDDSVKEFQIGYNSSAAGILNEFASEIFADVNQRKSTISERTAAPGRAQTLLTGRQNILG